MNRSCFVFLCVITMLNINYCSAQEPADQSTKKPKIVALLTVRNEEMFIEQCLRALALVADAIVVLDDCSDDSTVAIIKSLVDQCHIERILIKTQWYRDEPGDRNKALQAGREIGGTHFIVLDADEMFTANCLTNDYLRSKILALKQGEAIQMRWIQLWKNTREYRSEKNYFENNYKACCFCDDGVGVYKSGFIHTLRVPREIKDTTYFTLIGDNMGILHFNFVNWRNLLVKKAWYRCMEHIRAPQRSVEHINQFYSGRAYSVPTHDDASAQVRPCPKNWFEGYDFFDSTVGSQPELWREKQILGWFNQYGKDYFSQLEIWDIDWGTFGNKEAQ